MSKTLKTPAPPDTAATGARIVIVDVPLDVILDNPYQTRQTYDESAIADLAADIRTRGLLQPPVGRPVSCGEAIESVDINQVVQYDMYGVATWRKLPVATLPAVQLAFGHSRARACRAAGMTMMPLSLRVLTDEEMAEMAWAENEKRSDVGPLDAARALERMGKDFGWTQAAIAKRLGLDRSTVSNKLRVLRLPEPVLDALADRSLSERKAMALLAIYPMPEPALEEIADAFVERHYLWSRTGVTNFALRADSTADEVRNATARVVENLRSHLANSERDAKRQKEQEAQIERHRRDARAAGFGELPMQSDLPSPNEEFWSSKPAECAAGTCPCFARCISPYSGVKEVCTNPKRLRGLRTAATRGAKKEARAKVSGDFSARVEGALADGTPPRLFARLMLLASHGGSARHGDLSTACSQMGLPDEVMQKLIGSVYSAGTIEAWMKLGPERAAALAARTHLVAWQREYIETAGSSSTIESELANIEGERAGEELPEGWTTEATKGRRWSLYYGSSYNGTYDTRDQAVRVARDVAAQPSGDGQTAPAEVAA